MKNIVNQEVELFSKNSRGTPYLRACKQEGTCERGLPLVSEGLPLMSGWLRTAHEQGVAALQCSQSMSGLAYLTAH